MTAVNVVGKLTCSVLYFLQISQEELQMIFWDFLEGFAAIFQSFSCSKTGHHYEMEIESS